MCNHINYFAQDYRTSKWQSQNLKSGPSRFKIKIVPLVCFLVWALSILNFYFVRQFRSQQYIEEGKTNVPTVTQKSYGPSPLLRG